MAKIAYKKEILLELISHFQIKEDVSTATVPLLREYIDNYLAEKGKESLDEYNYVVDLESNDYGCATSVSRITTNSMKVEDFINIIRQEGETKGEFASRFRTSATELLPVSITNMNTNENELPAKSISIGNSICGEISCTIKLQDADVNYLPVIVIPHLREAQCQIIVKVDNSRSAGANIAARLVPHYSVQILESDNSKLINNIEQAKLGNDS